MSDYGILAKQIYQDKLSGKNFDRPSYQALLKKLKPGDTPRVCHLYKRE